MLALTNQMRLQAALLNDFLACLAAHEHRARFDVVYVKSVRDGLNVLATHKIAQSDRFIAEFTRCSHLNYVW